MTPELIVPHKYRPERRALWLRDEHKLRFQFLRNGEWQNDYTVWDYEAQSDYFRDFYGAPDETTSHE